MRSGQGDGGDAQGEPLEAGSTWIWRDVAEGAVPGRSRCDTLLLTQSCSEAPGRGMRNADGFTGVEGSPTDSQEEMGPQVYGTTI